MRLDLYLVETNRAQTRNKAQEMIKKGFVSVDNKVILKPNYDVCTNQEIKILSELEFVSRAGYKLKKALEEFKIDVDNKTCLDIGASTGGFVDCLLQNGAKKVYALDCGTDQLAKKLLDDNKVVNLANTNLKEIPNLEFDHLDIITCDVSFISLKHVFAAIESLIDSDTILIFLIKPQFELSKEIVEKNNFCIKKESDRQKAIHQVQMYANEHKINLVSIIESPITGAKLENIEYLGLFKYINKKD